MDFILKARETKSRSTFIKTIETSDLGADIGRKHGLQVINTLTGFKHIGDQITVFESNVNNEFLMEYQESYGFLVGTHARDKDAVVTSLILGEWPHVIDS